MYTLKDDGIINEIACGNNFGYILINSEDFLVTDYKVLQSQTNGIFIPCMKLLFNGELELYYLVDEWRTLISIVKNISPDALVNVIINLFRNVVDVRNNGFLACQNIDISWDKIYVDPNTYKVKLVYLPIQNEIFDNYAQFEMELRSGLIKLINMLDILDNIKIRKMLEDLANASLSLDELIASAQGISSNELRNGDSGNLLIKDNCEVLQLILISSQNKLKIEIRQNDTIIGKNADLADVVISFNKMISRRHCRIIRHDNNFWVSDENSANGTYLNRVRLIPGQFYPIKRGDILRLADCDFQIK